MFHFYTKFGRYGDCKCIEPDIEPVRPGYPRWYAVYIRKAWHVGIKCFIEDGTDNKLYKAFTFNRQDDAETVLNYIKRDKLLLYHMSNIEHPEVPEHVLRKIVNDNCRLLFGAALALDRVCNNRVCRVIVRHESSAIACDMRKITKYYLNYDSFKFVVYTNKSWAVQDIDKDSGKYTLSFAGWKICSDVDVNKLVRFVETCEKAACDQGLELHYKVHPLMGESPTEDQMEVSHFIVGKFKESNLEW